jgi:hypothetical protein
MSDPDELMLEKCLTIDFFRQVGREFGATSPHWSTVRVSSWREAIEIRGSNDASNSFNEGRNRLSRKVGTEHRERFRSWNEVSSNFCGQLEERLFPTVVRLIGSISDLHSIDAGPEFVESAIRWDLAMAHKEQVYSDIVEPAVYTAILSIYEAGHFVCRWDRQWPKGRFWVY